VRHLIALAVLPVALLFAATLAAAFPDSTESPRSVEGKVTDAAGKIVTGAVVQIKDLKSLQIRSFITQSDGAYRFLGLSPETDYELSANYAGASSKTRTFTVFDNRKKAVIDLKLK
jgi:hypothetical protein